MAFLAQADPIGPRQRIRIVTKGGFFIEISFHIEDKWSEHPFDLPFDQQKKASRV